MPVIAVKNIRGFQVNPGGTGDIKVTLDRSEGVNTIQIFQEDAFVDR